MCQSFSSLSTERVDFEGPSLFDHPGSCQELPLPILAAMIQPVNITVDSNSALTPFII